METAKLNQSIYCRNVSASELNSKKVVLEERFSFCFHRKQNTVDFFIINKNQIWLGDTSWKTTRQVMYLLSPLHGNSSETRWDLINLVSYRILMTYYYMAWIEVWLYTSNKLLKLTDVFYLPKHKTKNKLPLADFCTPHISYWC